MVETHLNEADHQKTMQWFSTRGFGALGQPAAESTKGGTNAGMLLLYPSHLHFHYVHEQCIDGRGWYGVMWNFANLDIILVMAYFKCGEGIQGSTNALLWSGLLTFTTGIQQPVAMMGDFNITPEEFMTTTMASIMQVQVLATGEETCNSGRELDWALVSSHLIPDMRVRGTQLCFHLERTLTPVVQQIQRYNPAPRLEGPVQEWQQNRLTSR